jgi:hypothetical protein
VNLGEVATRDWIRSELEDLLKELDGRPAYEPAAWHRDEGDGRGR